MSKNQNRKWEMMQKFHDDMDAVTRLSYNNGTLSLEAARQIDRIVLDTLLGRYRD